MAAMTHAYFDTNVYDRIDKGEARADEVEALRAALARGALVAHLSLADVEELLGQWQTDRAAAVGKLRLARDLVGFDGLLKAPATLLTEAIQAYAAGTPAPSITLPPDQLQVLVPALNDVADAGTKFDSVVSGIGADVRRNKEKFLAGMAEAGAQAAAELTPETLEQARQWGPTFDLFWEKAAPLYAEDFADRLGLASACRERGLDGLLDVRAVRLSVGVALSLVFSQVVEGRDPHRGDGYDMWHAVLGSTADVFLTLDERLAGHLERIPRVTGFRVVRSLRELLDLPVPS
jgi:hypothetical protein